MNDDDMRYSIKSIFLVISILFLVLLSYLAIHDPHGEEITRTPIHYKVGGTSTQSDSTNSGTNEFERPANRGFPLELPQDPADIRTKNQMDFETWVIKGLKRHFKGRVLTKAYFSFLIRLRSYLRNHFPEDWEEKFETIIKTVFPDSADRIAALCQKVNTYESWFERNKNLLATMTQGEIKTVLWQIRTELLGEDAVWIWDMDSNKEYLQDLVAIFNDATHIALGEKLKLFAEAWNEMHTDRIHDYHMQFIKLDSVQAQLQQLTIEKREAELALIRRNMGYDEHQIKEMEKFDLYQEDLWRKGRRYMAEREDIVTRLKGSARERALRVLRKRYFNTEANMIAAEEASHVYRFMQKRIYGYN